MPFKYHFRIYLSFLFINVSAFFVNLQAQNVFINQDLKYEQILNEKRKINAFLSINDSYKFQVFIGNSENAKKALNSFRKEFPELDATIVFNTPNYKVWVGGFRTRMGAEKTLVQIRDRFKKVIFIKPNN